MRDITELGEIVAHLASTTLFANIDRERLLPFAPIFASAHYQPGEVIAQEGQVDTSLRVLIEGSVALQHERQDGRLENQGLLAYGACLGLSGVFTGQPRPNTAIAFEPVSLLYLDGAVLWEILQTDASMLDRLVLPDDIREEMRRPGSGTVAGSEAEVAIFRRHWLTVAPRLILVPGVIFLLVALLVIPVSNFLASPLAMLILAAIAIAAAFGSAIWIFFDYWHDYLAVTNRRVLHVERTPLIDERRSAARLERIQDIRFVQPNLLSRLLDFGNISIQTAGSKTTVEFKTVAHPLLARDTIFGQVKLAKDLAQSERQALIARKVLAAVGKSPMSPAEELQATSLGLEPEPLSLLRPILDYLLPRTRMEDAEGTITWRKHWWVLLRQIWPPAFLLAFLVATCAWIVMGAAPVAPDILTSAWPGLSLAGLVLLLWCWWAFEDWRNDLYVLTDELIIDIERKPLGLFADQRQAPLSQIQDVRFVIPNPWAALLKYGNILIETAADKGSFTFDYIYHPDSVQEEIFFRMEQREARAQKAEQDRRDEELIRWIAAYHRVTNYDPADPEVAQRMAEWMLRNPPPA
jgi:hypothetical protein